MDDFSRFFEKEKKKKNKIGDIAVIERRDRIPVFRYRNDRAVDNSLNE